MSGTYFGACVQSLGLELIRNSVAARTLQPYSCMRNGTGDSRIDLVVIVHKILCVVLVASVEALCGSDLLDPDWVCSKLKRFTYTVCLVWFI